jgi:hypothetical protein
MGSPESVILTYMRGGGMPPPQDNEYFYAEDNGAFVLWRSIAWATYPPTPVGRFADRLPLDEIEALKREVKAAEAAGRLRQRSSPDSAVETIETPAGGRADVGVRDVPQNDWAPLVARLRKYLLDLTRFPEAALSLTLSEDGQHAALKRLGAQPLRIDLSQVMLKAALWKPSEQITLGEWSSGASNLGGIVNAEPGWTFELPFQPDFKRQAGDAVKLSVTLKLFDGEQSMLSVLST